MKGMLRKGLFAAATAAALGFGATQALAAPDEAAARRACDPSQDVRCMERCQSAGADTGVCDWRYLGGCRCIYY
jgi:hypothetical protein